MVVLVIVIAHELELSSHDTDILQTTGFPFSGA